MEIEARIRKALGDFKLDVELTSRCGRIGILGASGCGKSMTLKSIAGIERPDEGFIRIGDRVLFDSAAHVDIKPQKRNIGYLFQNYALFPTMTVRANIGAGLKGSRKENSLRVQEMIDKFQLSGLADRLPGQLSGGQQQRVALARIMAYEPDVILLDEPFSALDVFLKDRLQRELIEMLADYPGIVIMVSHSRDELYRFSGEILVMDSGKTVVHGQTKEIFARPRYREVARLTGCKNITEIRRLDSHTAEVTGWGVRIRTEKAIPEKAVAIGYRAHDFVPVWGERRENCLKFRLESMAELPFENNYYLLPEAESAASGEEGAAHEAGNPGSGVGNTFSGAEERTICWFVQRDQMTEMEERGMPDYLEIREEKIMFLEDQE